jgi:hypothetical protein
MPVLQWQKILKEVNSPIIVNINTMINEKTLNSLIESAKQAGLKEIIIQHPTEFSMAFMNFISLISIGKICCVDNDKMADNNKKLKYRGFQFKGFPFIIIEHRND